MTFTSISFFVLFFLTYVALLVIDYSKNIKKCVHKPLLVKHIVLLVSSYIFYGWWDYRFCVLMAFLSMVSWYCAKNIEINNYRKLFSLIGIVTPLVVLAFFKYFNFFVDSFCDAFNVQYSGTLNIILPVGISFYTFQSMSYTIDVIRGNIKTHSLLEVILYVSELDILFTLGSLTAFGLLDLFCFCNSLIYSTTASKFLSRNSSFRL